VDKGWTERIRQRTRRSATRTGFPMDSSPTPLKTPCISFQARLPTDLERPVSELFSNLLLLDILLPLPLPNTTHHPYLLLSKVSSTRLLILPLPSTPPSLRRWLPLRLKRDLPPLNTTPTSISRTSITLSKPVTFALPFTRLPTPLELERPRIQRTRREEDLTWREGTLAWEVEAAEVEATRSRLEVSGSETSTRRLRPRSSCTSSTRTERSSRFVSCPTRRYVSLSFHCFVEQLA
jgi:hypothetical protein